MSSFGDPPTWRLLGSIHACPGYAYGSEYPSLMVSLAGAPLDAHHREALLDNCRHECPSFDWKALRHSRDLNWTESVNWLFGLWQAVQIEVGLPVHVPVRVLAISSGQVRFSIPTLRAAQQALAHVIKHAIVALEYQRQRPADSAHCAKMKAAIKHLRDSCPQASNVPRFVKAAHSLGIPFQELPGGTYQYGVGRRSCWMDSSFTEVTPIISAKLSKNKLWASELLRQAGIPVPDHELVGSAVEAKMAAERLGYPVVVKPVDCDGGIGVAAAITCATEVGLAFERAKTFSENILVEKHIWGRDYRITVFNGRAVWAIERVPSGVLGNGNDSVAELVRRVNGDPHRGTGQHAPLKRVTIDAEALALLKCEGFDEASVPSEGQFVRLRSVANIASGGTPLAVFDHLHPDNARLAVRAAEVLRLDLAGIDLLIPDIGVSWRKSRAAICEVNGQPNLGQTTAAHLYPRILKDLVPGSGRVPTIVVFGAENAGQWLDAISRELSLQGLKVGVGGGGEAHVDGERVNSVRVGPYAAGRMLTLNRSVEAIVLAIDDDSVLATGLPMARYDAVIVAGAHLSAGSSLAQSSRDRWLTELLACILPACDGQVIVAAGESINLRDCRKWTKAAVRSMDYPQTEYLGRSVELVADVIRGHV